MRLFRDGIHASQQQVHRVRFLGPQTLGQLSADEARDGRGSQIGVVAHRVELDVGLDVFGELHYPLPVSRLCL